MNAVNILRVKINVFLVINACSIMDESSVSMLCNTLLLQGKSHEAGERKL